MSSMRFPSREEVEKVRNEYPKGCRVVLERMDDMQAPPIGTEGTVRGVDDTGSIMVKWDNGKSDPDDRDPESQSCICKQYTEKCQFNRRCYVHTNKGKR